MKKIRSYTSAFILLAALFFAFAVQAKTSPLTTAPAPVNDAPPAVAPPQYGSTTVAPASDKFATSSSSSSLNGNGGVGNGNGNGNQDHLPINNGLVFLLAAGLAIGIRVMATGNKKEMPLEV